MSSPSPSPSPSHVPLPAAGVLFQALDDGAVLFSPSTELYFGLNHVGARVWQLLAPGLRLGELCARLHESYPDADRSTLNRDVRELLDRLATEGLVVAPAAQA
ncbi:MAG: PqqD family protein [Gemmatimonadaceae bacterium]